MPAELFPGPFSPAVMSLSLYPGFKSYRAIQTATANRSNTPENCPTDAEAPCHGDSSASALRTGQFSRDTVNPSAEQLDLGAGIRTVGDRRWVFNTNTKMNPISISTQFDGIVRGATSKSGRTASTPVQSTLRPQQGRPAPADTAAAPAPSLLQHYTYTQMYNCTRRVQMYIRGNGGGCVAA